MEIILAIPAVYSSMAWTTFFVWLSMTLIEFTIIAGTVAGTLLSIKLILNWLRKCNS